ncbi:ABC transporter ATP-binding protein [Lacrimispora sp. 38-1]|uniref:ABC transporter ATP-binding protein n=1 Tax=Lacrimispora sp. 38-1 TaxID=3125778 RepID=UPI003CE67F63
MSIIEVQNFSKGYGPFMAVDNISMEIKKGEIVGFVGKNGAGKTTTIRSMMNLISPTKGKIIINGLDSVKDSKKIKHTLGYMPGDCSFYDNAKGLDIFKLCLKISNGKLDRVTELAEYFELDLNKRISELSLGNRKKVSIIQAVLKNNEILVLDEPTSGLDPLMQRKFFDLICRQKEIGVTVFLSSHNLNEIEKYCDKVIILKDGKIVESLDMHSINIKHKQLISYTTKDGTAKNFEFDGNVNELIASLSKLDLESIEIKAATIEDEFIKYYKEEEVHE